MFSKQEGKRMAATAFVSVAVTLGGVFAYGVPSNAERARVDDRPGIADSATFGPWIENLSASAVDAGGIEADLDGNASALFASDYAR
jgi:hypothetical protein